VSIDSEAIARLLAVALDAARGVFGRVSREMTTGQQHQVLVTPQPLLGWAKRSD
jgi:hypothetical protein